MGEAAPRVGLVHEFNPTVAFVAGTFVLMPYFTAGVVANIFRNHIENSEEGQLRAQ